MLRDRVPAGAAGRLDAAGGGAEAEGAGRRGLHCFTQMSCGMAQTEALKLAQRGNVAQQVAVLVGQLGMPSLCAQVAPIIERGLSKEVPEEAPGPAGAPATIAALSELQRPLLAEEAPPTPAGERAGLSKALAIIRWAWTVGGRGGCCSTGAAHVEGRCHAGVLGGLRWTSHTLFMVILFMQVHRGHHRAGSGPTRRQGLAW